MNLRTLQDWVVKRQLSGIPGVVEVNTWVGYLKQYEVAIDPEKLRTLQSDSQYVFKKQRVKTGRTADGQVELLDPQSLRSDRKVLVSGAFALIGDN